MTKVEKRFRKVCQYVIDNSHYIIAAGRAYGVNTILESFNAFEKDKQFNILKDDIQKEYGISYEDLKTLFVNKIIDTELCEMIANVKLGEFKNIK